ncbi:MAG: hypothetical protein ACRENW_09000 [Thermodesulfobacteriota bacterium]
MAGKTEDSARPSRESIEFRKFLVCGGSRVPLTRMITSMRRMDARRRLDCRYADS